MRKICIAVLSRANYGRVKSVMKAVQDHPDLELQVIIGGSANLERFGNVLELIEEDGFTASHNLHFAVEGDDPGTMSKTTGLGIIQISNALELLRPDVVVTVADRYETMATAIAASYQNIILAHIQGGEVTGSIDESVRHAITKLSHIHFPCTEKAMKNIVKMGEDKDFVFNVGCPAIDTIKNSTKPNIKLSKLTGTGFHLKDNDQYNLVVFHPVTTSHFEAGAQAEQLLKAISIIDKPTIWLWPNIDAGTDRISKVLRSNREIGAAKKIRFIKNLPVEMYNQLLSNAEVLIGNSSSFIREGSYLGKRAVIIGSRQNQREVAENVVRCFPKKENILDSYANIIARSVARSDLYGQGNAGKRIAEVLANELPSIQKVLAYD